MLSLNLMPATCFMKVGTAAKKCNAKKKITWSNRLIKLTGNWVQVCVIRSLASLDVRAVGIQTLWQACF